MSSAETFSARLFRAGSSTRHDIWLDCFWLTVACLLLVATGIGLRDPWPADEPRFALIARDMLYSGDWLVPRVAGDIYADKPPLYFWMIAIFLQATGSLRVAFLLPSLLSAVGCVLLVYDLGRRLWRREMGLLVSIALLFTVQFVWQARQAQIDATLCFWTTLGLYALLRHLLLGPRWGWYAVGWAAAGFGVITKGVGFLPLLILIPFALLRSSKWKPRVNFKGAWRWALGPLALLLAVSIWLVPMLLAARDGGALAAYRDEILFRQTMDRYAKAWHHREPFWYFFTNVIPWLWLPLTLLIPWLLPKWRHSWRDGDLRVVLPLFWAILVVLFFSFSSGKRGVYVLPALPAFALACAPFLDEIFERRSVQRTIFALAVLIAGVCATAAVFVLLRSTDRAEVIERYAIDPLGPLAAMGAVGFVACVTLRTHRGLLAYATVICTTLLTVSFWINPAMNADRSGASFIARVEQAADPNAELGFVGFKEQYVLQARRPIVHFGHARWREAQQETDDAALWLSRDPTRQLLVGKEAKNRCFANAQITELGTANREQWFLVRGEASTSCASDGQEDVAIQYGANEFRREFR